MGYRSQVHLLFGMSSKSHLQQLVSVYQMLPAVQKNNLMNNWDYHVEKITFSNQKSLTVHYLHCHGDDWKWYDRYEDVQALQAIEDLGKKFWSERKFPFAYRLVRTGEDSGDVEEYDNTTVTDEDTNMPDSEDAETMSNFFQGLIYPYHNIEVNINQDVSESLTKLEEGETK